MQITLPRTTLARPGFRFELRPYDFSSVASMYEAIQESRTSIRPWMGWLHEDYSRENVELWTAQSINAWNLRSSYEFIIYDREDGAVTGSCGLNQINLKDRLCNLGYWVRTSKMRLGAATQAVNLLSDFGLEKVGLNRIEIVAAEGNVASRGVAAKAGAIYEGLLRSRVCVGEKVHDAHLYALIRRPL